MKLFFLPSIIIGLVTPSIAYYIDQQPLNPVPVNFPQHPPYPSILSSSTKLYTTTRPIPKPTPAPKPPTTATGYPLCGTPGFTNAMGNYHETTHVRSGGNIRDCIYECQISGGECKSIAFHRRYEMCLWYDKEVEGTWLSVDWESEFVHWDLGCEVW